MTGPRPRRSGRDGEQCLSPWVAEVDGHRISLAEVDRRAAELRSGPRGALLPPPDTAEGRNLRRWLVQLVAAERVVRNSCAARGIDTAGAPTARLDLGGALRLGGVAAAMLHRMPGAIELAAEAGPTAVEVADHHQRNRDRYPQPLVAAAAVIAAELARQRRATAFGHWLDVAMASRVRLAPGFEHPGEPGHPDATHRH